MQKKNNEKIKITKSSGNIFADIGLPDAEKYLAKAELAKKINFILEKIAPDQKKAAQLLNIDQPKISALNCGKLDDFSLERLITFLNKLECNVEIIIKEPHHKKTHKAGHLTVAFD